ncbi:MAG: hypothetical protein PHQ35_10860 [Phycisphaerae bacterium]|nr:hypothetical protein [Phycisphaerae bacterium]
MEGLIIFGILWILGMWVSGGFNSNKKSDSETSQNSSDSDNSFAPRNSDAAWTHGGNKNCDHYWHFDCRGADGWKIYKCSKCGMREKRIP